MQIHPKYVSKIGSRYVVLQIANRSIRPIDGEELYFYQIGLQNLEEQHKHCVNGLSITIKYAPGILSWFNRFGCIFKKIEDGNTSRDQSIDYLCIYSTAVLSHTTNHLTNLFL